MSLLSEKETDHLYINDENNAEEEENTIALMKYNSNYKRGNQIRKTLSQRAEKTIRKQINPKKDT